MILADKIIELRKKSGWSQEELADRLGVSRQSISKWEGAQSVPDMNRILKISEVFGVSTDYLLKDELSLPDIVDTIPVDTDSVVKRVSMEEASSFLQFKDVESSRVSLGVMLCIFSPVLLIILAALQEAGRIGLSENQAAGIGLAALLVLIATAVALFVVTSIQGNRYEYMEKEAIDTEYGVDGMAREKQEKFRPAYTGQLTSGIVLCVASVIPLFLSMILYGGDDDLPYTISAGILLILVGLGVYLIVRASIIWGGTCMLLEEGDYTRRKKEEERKNAPVAAIYCGLAVAIYLGYSFVTNRWDQSWIIWPVAGVGYGVVAGIMKLIRDRA